MKKNEKFLVLGDDTRSFLSVIRSLGRSGAEVHVGWYRGDHTWYDMSEMALRSRYISKAHEIPPYSDHDTHWKTALIELMSRERFDLVIPCGDPSIIPLQQHRHDIEPFGRIYLLSDNAFEVVFDKIKTNEMARSVGVNVPREYIVTGVSEITQIQQHFDLPVVLKPQSSYSTNDVTTKNLVQKAYDWANFRRILQEMLANGPVAVQENFIGDGVGLELLLEEGGPLLAFQHVRVHEPLQGGGSSYRKGVPVSPDLLEAALRMLKSVSYTGVAMVEFKVNPKTGQWVLIEINGRFWGSLPLAIASGADFPRALADLFLGSRMKPSGRYRVGIHSRNLVKDLEWQLANLRADKLDPTLAVRSLPTVIMETIINVTSFKERIDTFTLDDPRPFFAELVQITKKLSRGIRGNFKRKYLTSQVVRLRLKRRAHRAVLNAKTILFLCKGNICRSPFAACLAQRLLPGRNILSAGYINKEGRHSPEDAISSARNWKIDLSRHRSMVLTSQMIDEADAIIVFDYDNYEQLAVNFPGARNRTHFLGSLNSDGPLIINDPWGENATQFLRVYEQISKALFTLVAVDADISDLDDATRFSSGRQTAPLA